MADKEMTLKERVWGDESPDDADLYSWSERAMAAGWIDPNDYSPGVIAILRERERQKTEEGWTPEHDDGHDSGELARAASCYAWASAQSDMVRDVFRNPPPVWPDEWDIELWKLKSRRSDLVRAGALIAAEIDRIDRAAPQST